MELKQVRPLPETVILRGGGLRRPVPRDGRTLACQSGRSRIVCFGAGTYVVYVTDC